MDTMLSSELPVLSSKAGSKEEERKSEHRRVLLFVSRRLCSRSVVRRCAFEAWNVYMLSECSSLQHTTYNI